MESGFQSGSGPRECLVVKMTTTHSISLAAEVPAYAQLQREMHEALLAQHPEWILPNGESPTCDSYDERFAELLLQTVTTRPRGLKKRNTSQSQFEFPHPAFAVMAH